MTWKFFQFPGIRNFRTRLSIKKKLVALYVLIFGVTLLLFSALFYRVTYQNHEADFDAALYNYTLDVAQVVELDLFGGIALSPRFFQESEKVFPFSSGDSLIQVRTLQGKVIARSRSGKSWIIPLRLKPEELMAQKINFESLSSSDLGISDSTLRHKRYRVIVALLDKPGLENFVLQIAVPTTLLERQRKNLLTFLGFTIPLVLLIAALSGLYFTRKALEPVHAMIEKTKAISPSDLSQRLPVSDTIDEIHELASTFNLLLERIERSFNALEQFLSDASHQLKTPLAILKGELDYLKKHSKDPKEISNFLESARQEISGLSKMVENLLILARADAGPGALHFKPTALDEAIIQSIRRTNMLAEAKKIRIQFHLEEIADTTGGSPERISDNPSNDLAEMNETSYLLNEGDATLLEILFENLIENAVKYSPLGTTINVRLESKPHYFLIEVADQGPGIAEEAKERIFDRFYRATDHTQSTPTAQTPGSGLGLAIAQKITFLHKGEIAVENLPTGGARFRVLLPKTNLSISALKQDARRFRFSRPSGKTPVFPAVDPELKGHETQGS